MTREERQLIETGEAYAREQLELQENMEWIKAHAGLVNRIVKRIKNHRKGLRQWKI